MVPDDISVLIPLCALPPQIGMFSFTGLTPAQVENMTNKHQV